MTCALGRILALFVGALHVLAWPATADAQPLRAVRIGLLSSGAASGTDPGVEAFRSELRELGYVEGQNLVIEYRWADGHDDRLASLAADLVRVSADIIVARGAASAIAARAVTRTIPIVFANTGRAVGTGQSPSRPALGVTGLTTVVPGLAAKRLELLREALPGVLHVAVLANPGNEVSAAEARETIAAARAHGVSIVLHEAGTPTRLNAVFTAIRGEGSLAVIVLPDVMFLEQRTVICNLAARHGVPVVAWTDEFVEHGALMSYGPSAVEMHRRAAAVVDRILKGIDPVELPVAEPATFELAINRKTAARLGLSISPTVADRADRVIQ